MRRICYLLIISISAWLSSCNIVTSDNGDLDGLWQLTTMENLNTGTVADGRNDDVTWAFQHHLLAMRSGDVEVFFRFSHADHALAISNPYHSGRFLEGNDDTPVTDVTSLYVFGVYKLEELFEIVQLDDDNMQLKSESMRLFFRKY